MGQFGWSLPPGVTNKMIEDQMKDPDVVVPANIAGETLDLLIKYKNKLRVNSKEWKEAVITEKAFNRCIELSLEENED